MDDDDLEGKDRSNYNYLNELLGSVSRDQGEGRPMKMQPDLSWKPPLDVVETDREIAVLVEIAGMSGRDITVVTDGRTLRINGVRRNTGFPGKKQFHKLEIQSGPFERVVELPALVDQSAVTARYKNGLLTIRVKKVSGGGGERTIEID